MKNTLHRFRLKMDRSNRFLFKSIKFIVFTFENYKKSRSELWTSTLTFYSLLTIVPILAILFVITRVLGVENTMKDSFYHNFFVQGKLVDQIMTFSQNATLNVKGGLIAGTGILFLLWSVIKIFSVVEKAFNEIWRVEEARSIVRKLTDYISLIFLFPLLIIFSNGLSLALKILFKTTNNNLYFLLNYLPFILTILFFTIIYLIIPNTKVKFSSALIAGIFAGIAFQVIQFAFVRVQINLMAYNSVYGSFSLVPLFIFWQKIVWFIVLLGAHLSFLLQNSYKYSYSINEINLSYASKRDISLLCVYYFIENYIENKPALSTRKVAEKIDISIGMTQNILNSLKKLGYLVEIVTTSEHRKYKLALNINEISIKRVLDDISEIGFHQEVGRKAKRVLKKIDYDRENLIHSTLLKSIYEYVNTRSLTEK